MSHTVRHLPGRRARAGSGPRSRSGRRSSRSTAWLTRLLDRGSRRRGCRPRHRPRPRRAAAGRRGPRRAAVAATAVADVDGGPARHGRVDQRLGRARQSPVILSLADPMGCRSTDRRRSSVAGDRGGRRADRRPTSRRSPMRPAGESQASVRRDGRDPQPPARGGSTRDRRGPRRAGDGRGARPGRLGAARRPGAGRRHADARRRRRQAAGDLDPGGAGPPALPGVDGGRPRRGPALRARVDSARFKVSPACGRAIYDGRATSSTAGAATWPSSTSSRSRTRS